MTLDEVNKLGQDRVRDEIELQRIMDREDAAESWRHLGDANPFLKYLVD